MKAVNFALITCCFASLGAAPYTITTGTSLTLNFNGFYNSSPILIPGLTSVVTLQNFTFTATTLSGQPVTRVNFDYIIGNTSATPVLTSRVSNFAFDTTPTILNTAANTVTGVFNSVSINANQPNGIGTVEVCFTAANCPGGGSGGVTKGNSGGGSAALYYGGTISSLSLDNAFVRYQSVTCTAGSPCSGSASGSIVPPPSSGVPEPSTYAMLSMGLAAVAACRRKFHTVGN